MNMKCDNCDFLLERKDLSLIDDMINKLNKYLFDNNFDQINNRVCFLCIEKYANHIYNETKHLIGSTKDQDDVEEQRFIKLNDDDQDYLMIKRLFDDRSLKYEIIRIEKNINPELYQKHLIQLYKSNKSKEYLFHGSNNDNYNNILKNGFDISKAKSSGLLGAGIYFAKYLTYSNSYTNPLKTEIGDLKNVLLCSVAFNEFKNSGDIFAVFDQNDGYPEFIIYYK